MGQRTWKCARMCPVCGAPNPPKRQTCSDECKKARKAEYDRARHEANPEVARGRASAWQRANKDRKAAYDAEYRTRTVEHRLATKRAYSRQWRLDNPELARLRGAMVAHARRARLLDQGCFKVLDRDLRRALHRARHRCAECENPFTDDNPLEWDHTVPIVRGGSHGIGNLRPLCRRCNRNKLRRFLVEWHAGVVVAT